MFHDPALTEDPGLLEGAAAAVRLTVANAAMRREALDRVARLAEARRRIVEAADVEAQALAGRLERGPRSRLGEVSRALADLDTDRCADSATAVAVRQELAAAHRELQELAHGARPRSLTEGGLARALPSLSAGMPTVTRLTVEIGRLDAAVEAGLYFFCAEALTNVTKHASASEVRMTVRAEPGAVVAEVVDDGIGGADPEGSGLRGLRDRIAALGGTLAVESNDARGGVRLVARIPTAEGIER
jgi:signal transduction histidine kinase